MAVNQNLIATVVADGLQYNYWTSIEIERRYEDVIMHMRLRCSEFADIRNANGIAALRLKPGDPAQGYLGDQLAITGQVCLRQATYDKDSHAVEIVVAGNTQALDTSTVDGNPGFYKNYTFSQIANATANKVGVNVIVQGAAAQASASKPFPRVSEHIGETRHQFIARLAQLRNLYLVPDQVGNLLATQGTGAASGNSGAVGNLVEGQNIEAARLTLRNDEYSNPIRTIGQNFAGSLTTTDDETARNVTATVTAPDEAANTPATVLMPHPGDNQDAAWYAARVAAYALATYIQGEIVVSGWFLDDGDLWINHVGDLVTIYSPMLVPTNTITLAIKGVIHRQNNEDGTQTVIEVCDPGSLGALGRINTTGAGSDAFSQGFGSPVPGQQ